MYVRNLKSDVTDDQLREKFEAFGKVERVKKVKDYGFVHFESRENAMKAMEELNATVSISAVDTDDGVYYLTIWIVWIHVIQTVVRIRESRSIGSEEGSMKCVCI